MGIQQGESGYTLPPHHFVRFIAGGRMAWVLIGSHKINTALVCYAEQEGDTVRIYFHGEWEGNPIDLHFDEAKALWKYLKAEDVMLGRDKGSTHVIPKSAPST